jgi:hypothetical protein
LSARDWTLTIRAGSTVEHERHDSLEDAIEALAAALRALEPSAPRGEQRLFARHIEPVQQVAARLELAGPRGQRGGVDLRGDGSSEPFSGRLRRRVIERRKGESAADALRRALAT